VLQGNADAGLVIHEGRFTYAEKGLAKIADLGELWQEKTGLPIPLGCIVIKKSLGEELKKEVEALIAQSIPTLHQAIILSDFIKMHAQEMEPQVMLQHIQLYVNDFSKDIGPLGEAAFAKMETVLSAKE
jgi:1,4-dihydroxy-6-naphthoate synthase